MDESRYMALLSAITPIIEKQDTAMLSIWKELRRFEPHLHLLSSIGPNNT